MDGLNEQVAGNKTAAVVVRVAVVVVAVDTMAIVEMCNNKQGYNWDSTEGNISLGKFLEKKIKEKKWFQSVAVYFSFFITIFPANVGAK